MRRARAATAHAAASTGQTRGGDERRLGQGPAANADVAGGSDERELGQGATANADAASGTWRRTHHRARVTLRPQRTRPGGGEERRRGLGLAAWGGEERRRGLARVSLRPWGGGTASGSVGEMNTGYPEEIGRAHV